MISPASPESTSLALAVDFGGTKVAAGLVDAAGRVLDASRFRAPTGPTATSEQLEQSVRTVVTQALAARPADAAIIGVGIGSAGPVSVTEGLVSPLNVPAWRDYPLRDLVASLVDDTLARDSLARDTPVVLRIDGECIALAEHWVGAAQGENCVLGMVVSTGIGGGIIIGGRAIGGSTGNAGHIGHVAVGGFTDPCLCGGTGCVEAVASGPKTTAWAQSQGWVGATGEDLAASYAAGDPIARRAVERSGHAIGQAIASATALLDFDLVAIGGGFSHVTPDLFTHIRAAIAEHAPYPFVAKVRVVPSGLSGSGPLVGAAALIHRADHRS